MRARNQANSEADICIFVEGTYPYVTGGVSSWIHQLVSNLPEFSFSIFHLGSKPDPERLRRYEFPCNVVGFQEVFLNYHPTAHKVRQPAYSAKHWREMQRFHEALGQQDTHAALETLTTGFGSQPGIAEMVYSESAWECLLERYYAHAPSSPFLHYFWTFRSTHLPLFELGNASFPKARLYHAVSTGYAGYAAALAKLRNSRPMLITEHGIYTRERDMEIALSSSIDPLPEDPYQLDPSAGVFRSWWMSMFRFMSVFAYQNADRIVSITRSNQDYQLRDGADETKLQLISNGIDVDRFSKVPERVRTTGDDFNIGFVGRVVAIKDVKCFLQAISLAGRSIPCLRAYIIGPTDEEPEYYEECRQLVNLLDIGEKVQFTGRANVLDYYARMDVLALTSLSEGQPLVILEANCAGVPIVASDVGACRDLLEGITPEDKSLGPSGLLTLAASPEQTAAALVRLWQDEALRKRMSIAGRSRVERFYRQDTMYAAYRQLYKHWLAPTTMAT